MSHRNSPITINGAIKVLPIPEKKDIQPPLTSSIQINQPSPVVTKETIAINEETPQQVIPQTEDKLLELETLKAHEMAIYSITLGIKDIPVKSFCYTLMMDEDNENNIELAYVVKNIDASNTVILKISNYSSLDRNIKINYHATF